MGCKSRSSRAAGALSLGRLRGSGRFLEDHLHLRQDRVMSGLLSLQNAPQMALVSSSHVRQAERHANVAVWRTLAASHAQRPEVLLRCGPIEPWVVDADAQPAILAWMGSYTR